MIVLKDKVVHCGGYFNSTSSAWPDFVHRGVGSSTQRRSFSNSCDSDVFLTWINDLKNQKVCWKSLLRNISSSLELTCLTLLLKVQLWVDVFFPAFPTVGFFGSTVEDFHPPNLTSQTLGSDPQDWLSRLDLSIMWGDPFCRFFLLIYFKIPLVACFTVNCECINIYIQNMFICDICIHIYIYISCIWYTAPCGVRFCQSNCTKPTWTWDKQTGLLGITKR